MGKKKRKRITTQAKSISAATLNKIFIAIIFILPLIYFRSLLLGSKMMYGSDWLLAGYPMRKWVADCIRQYGRGPMWDSSVFGGLPYGNPYTFHTLLYLILPVHVGWTYLFVFSVFFAGLGIYLYLKELHLSIYSSFLGAIAYMGCGCVLSMTYAGHDGKVLACAVFPFILLYLHKGLIRHKLIYFLLAGGIGGIAAVNAHFQLIYYASVMFAFYLLYHLIWQRKTNGVKGSLRVILYSFCGLILAGGLVAMHYLPIFGTMGWGARGEERGYEFATSWALSPAELLDLLTPHFSGILDNYWGENYFKLDAQYLGILPLLVALVAIAFNRKEKYVRFFIGLCIVTTIFALGRHTPLYRIPYFLLPGLKKFRGPSMIFYLTSFGVAVLSAFGTQSLTKTPDARHKTQDSRKMALLLGIVFGMVTLFWLICSAGKESTLSFLRTHFQPILAKEYGVQLTQQKLQNLEKNYPYFLGGLGKALFLIAINSILILLIATKRVKLGLWTLIAIPILIFDQWSIEKKFLRSVTPPEEYYARDEVVSFLGRDRTTYRIFPLHYEHAKDSYLGLYNIQSVGGYVGNPSERYQKFIGAGESVMFIPSNLIRHRRMLDILNTKYIISMWIPEDLSKYPTNTQRAVENFKLSFLNQWGVSWEEAHQGLKLIYRSNRGYGIYKNETALPRAELVHDFKVLRREDVLEELKSPDFHPETMVLLEEMPEDKKQRPEVRGQMTEGVTIKEYSPNKIVCDVTLDAPGFLVFSENWHPDWKAYVDGEKRKVYVANYTLRAVELGKGKHMVEFRYESLYFKLGAIVTFLSFLFLLGTIWFWIKKSKRRG